MPLRRGAQAEWRSRFLDACAQSNVVRSWLDRKSTRLNSSHVEISYAVFTRALHSFPTRRSSDLRVKLGGGGPLRGQFTNRRMRPSTMARLPAHGGNEFQCPSAAELRLSGAPVSSTLAPSRTSCGAG